MCWRRLLKVSCTARRSNQSILWEINSGRTDAEAEAPVFWSSDVNSWLIGKVPDVGKDWGRKEKRASEDEMAWQHHQCNVVCPVWTWENPWRWWGSGMPGRLQSMGSQRVGHDWSIEQQQQYVVLWDWLLSFSVMFSKSIHIATHVFYWWIVLHFMDMCLCAWLLSHVWLLQPHAWTVAHQSPLSVEFSRQEYWSMLPFPTSKDLSNQGLNQHLESTALAGRFFTTVPPGKPFYHTLFIHCSIDGHLSCFLFLAIIISQSCGFPIVMDGCESWTIKKAECQIDAFKLWCWRRLLSVPWTIRRSNQSILKEITPEYSLEGLVLKLKLQYFGHLMRRADSLEKTDAGKDWRQEKGATEDEMVGWHHQLNEHEFEQAQEVLKDRET